MNENSVFSIYKIQHGYVMPSISFLTLSAWGPSESDESELKYL